jgi:hypothetical protein
MQRSGVGGTLGWLGLPALVDHDLWPPPRLRGPAGLCPSRDGLDRRAAMPQVDRTQGRPSAVAVRADRRAEEAAGGVTWAQSLREAAPLTRDAVH